MFTQADSQLTFGDLGTFCQEEIYDISVFDSEDNNFHTIINATQRETWYSVQAIIKLGFMLQGRTLYIRPYIYGELIGISLFNTRTLDIGFAIKEVTLLHKYSDEPIGV